jgi:hypothetical protein
MERLLFNITHFLVVERSHFTLYALLPIGTPQANNTTKLQLLQPML